MFRSLFPGHRIETLKGNERLRNINLLCPQIERQLVNPNEVRLLITLETLSPFQSLSPNRKDV